MGKKTAVIGETFGQGDPLVKPEYVAELLGVLGLQVLAQPRRAARYGDTVALEGDDLLSPSGSLDEPVDTWANALSKAWDDESYHRQVGLAHHAGLRRSFAAESVARRFEGWIRELLQARWRGSSVEVRAAHGPVDQW